MRACVLALGLTGCWNNTYLADAAAGSPPACAIDIDCPLRMYCDPVAAHCACVAGYTADATGACAWTGVIADPGFSRGPLDPPGWSMFGGDGSVTIMNTVSEPEMVDPGVVDFHAIDIGVCPQTLIRIAQAIEMPRRSRTDPLVIEAQYRPTPGSSGTTPLGPQFGIGGSWHPEEPLPTLPFDPPSWRSVRTCLGAGDYAAESTGGPGSVVVFATELDLAELCLQTSDMQLDHVALVPALPGECPAVGDVPNGDAETSGGWTLRSAAIEAGVGQGGSRGVHLHADAVADCVRPIASVLMSIPFGATALTGYGTASAATTLHLAVGDPDYLNTDFSTETPIGSDVPASFRACIPPALRGKVQQLTAQATTLAAPCTTTLDAVVDNIALAADPVCDADPALGDGGFETTYAVIGARAVPPLSFAHTVHTPGLAHSGTGVLELTSSQTCDDPSWSAVIATPPRSTTGGAALAFYYRAPPGVKSQFFVSTFGFTPVQDGTWHLGVACLDSVLEVGMLQKIRFSLVTKTPYTCGQAFPATETAYIDDVTLTTDPGCPQ